jgi:hypothetical protein
VRGDRQGPLLGRVGLGAVGVESLQVVVHHLRQLAVRTRRGHPGERGIDAVEVDALCGCGRYVLGPDHGGDHRHLLGRDLAVGAGRGDCR